VDAYVSLILLFLGFVTAGHRCLASPMLRDCCGQIASVGASESFLLVTAFFMLTEICFLSRTEGVVHDYRNIYVCDSVVVKME
jgi:hypothetical protein